MNHEKPPSAQTEGDPRAGFARFVETYVDTRLRPVAITYTAAWNLNSDVALEILQESLTRTWRVWPTELVCADDERRLAFVFTTMAFVCKEEIRRCRRSIVVSPHDLPDLPVQPRDTEQILARTVLERLQDIYLTLNPHDQVLLSLVIAEVPHRQIAHSLRISTSNVSTRLCRIREKLRLHIGVGAIDDLEMGPGNSSGRGESDDRP